MCVCVCSWSVPVDASLFSLPAGRAPGAPMWFIFSRLLASTGSSQGVSEPVNASVGPQSAGVLVHECVR